MNSKIHQILVLLGVIKSPTFEWYVTKKEMRKMFNEIDYKGDD